MSQNIGGATRGSDAQGVADDDLEDCEIIGLDELADEKTYTQAEVEELLKKKQTECLGVFINREVELEVILPTGDQISLKGYFSRTEVGGDRLPYLRFQTMTSLRGRT